MGPQYGPRGILGFVWVHKDYIVGIQGSQGRGPILGAHGLGFEV